jgi:hypothetical protein
MESAAGARGVSDSLASGQDQVQGLTKEEKVRYISVLDATKYRGTGRWNISAAAREVGSRGKRWHTD